MAHPILFAGRDGNHRFVNALQSSLFIPAHVGDFEWIQDIQVVNGAIGAVALAAAATQEVDLNVAFPNNPFPTNVYRKNAVVWKITDFAGGSLTNVQFELGDNNDPNGLVTQFTAFTGTGQGPEESLAAAEAQHQLETAFVPTLTITATGDNVDAITSGKLQIRILHSPTNPQPAV